MAKRPLPVLPDGFADPRLPSGTFSHSQYSLYKNCPTAYEFRYVKRESAPTKPPMAKGVLFHSAAEHALRQRMAGQPLPSQEASAALIDAEFEEARATVDWGDVSPDDIKRGVKEAFNVYREKGLPSIYPVAVEELFTRKVGDVPMLGYVDVIHQVPGDFAKVVVDLKTSKAAWSDRDVKLDTQLTLYAIVHDTPYVQIDNVVTKAKGVDFQRKTESRTPTQFRVFVEDLNETADLIRRGIFPKAAIDHWMCSSDWCSYWSQCRGKTG